MWAGGQFGQSDHITVITWASGGGGNWMSKTAKFVVISP